MILFDESSCWTWTSHMQDNGLVPIVEPEMTLGAGDYTIEDTSYWSERVLTHVFRHLNEHDVMLEGILMKPSMCLPGEPPAQQQHQFTGVKSFFCCLRSLMGCRTMS